MSTEKKHIFVTNSQATNVFEYSFSKIYLFYP